MKKILLMIAVSFAISACQNPEKNTSSQIPKKHSTTEESDFSKRKNIRLQVINNPYYTIEYDLDLKGAVKVSYTIEQENVDSVNITKRPNFYYEKSLPSKNRTYHSDYTNTGYDRGHLANDASFDWSKSSLHATYSMANIVPMMPNVNRKGWLALEDYERYMARQFQTIDVTNIVKYKKDFILKKKPLDTILHNKKFSNAQHRNKYIKKYKRDAKNLQNKKIYVPIGFYKIIKTNHSYGDECFYIANEDRKPMSTAHVDYQVDCSKI